MSSRLAKKVLLVGWDAADWKVINPLLDAGKMPALQHLVENGVMANLATLHPVLSPMLWTSIATGVWPFKHGIHGFSEPLPDGSGVQPVTNLSRKCKAMWNILCQNGQRCNVVGWWPSHPAEPINGVMVSNNYQRAIGPPEEPWPMAPGTVHPERLRDPLAELRMNPNELGPEHVLPFIPRAAEIDQDKDRRLASAMKILAECTSIHSAATWLIEHEPWDFMAVYYDAIDHFCHGFMRYHPPRQDWIPERDFELYQHVVESGYRYHDMMLARLLELVDDETTVMLISDHGFHPDHLRPRAIPMEPAGPALEHRDFGIFVMAGPGIKRDELLHGANLLDIAPTVLTLFGLPIGQDMDGKPLRSAFVEPPAVESIATWEDVPGDDGRHPPDRKLDAHEAKEALEQLVALGYIERPDENAERAVANTVRELDYNLARSYMHANLYGEARPILERLYAKEPGEYRFGVQLAMCYRALDQLDALRSLVEELNDRRQRDALVARERLKELRDVIRQRRAARQEETARRQIEEPKADGPREESAALLSPQELAELQRLRSLAAVNTYALDYLAGYVDIAQGDIDAALKKLARAEQAEPDRPGLHIQIGEAYLKAKRWKEALRSYERAESIDPTNPHAQLGLARGFLGQRKNRLAATKALETVGLLYHQPLAHYCLGVALHRMGRIEPAVQALEVAIKQNPNFAEAHERLAFIYRRRLNNKLKAEDHRAMVHAIRSRQKSPPGDQPASALPFITPPLRATACSQTVPPSSEQPVRGTACEQAVAHEAVAPLTGEPITIVSGLPRSGTSMLMQMLGAGGLPVLSDGQREADEDNPRGYYELEQAKNLRNNHAWLADAQGKAVKIIAQLLPHLPLGLEYRVVFMEREFDEMLASQRKMLDRLGREGARIPDSRLKLVFARQVRAAKACLTHRQIPVLRISYFEAVQQPRETAAKLNEFLGGTLDQAAMVAAIDPTLYRQRR